MQKAIKNTFSWWCSNYYATIGQIAWKLRFKFHSITIYNDDLFRFALENNDVLSTGK